MAFLKVLNVQQGDCMTFRPVIPCIHRRELFYVDLGNGQFDVSGEIRADDEVHLILTHSHRDHIYGISYLLPYFNQVKEIILPYCFNEMWLIAKAILHLKGMRTASGCEELKRELIDIDSIQRILKNSLENPRLRITFAYDGLSLCRHIRFLNPPLPSVPAEWQNDDEYHRLEEETKEQFEEEFADDFLGYVRAQRGYNLTLQREYGADHAFYHEFITDPENRNPEQALHMSRAGCKMVLDFLARSNRAMRVFNAHPDRANLNKIIENYRMTAHDACLVTMLSGEGSTYLLGGDASKKVFNRLIREQSIQADYFKLPHHGSIKNMSDKILRNVAPSIAIISHGNARFGRAKDPHPNQAVLDLLGKRNIQILVTNDVIKNGKVVVAKTPYLSPDLEIE